MMQALDAIKKRCQSKANVSLLYDTEITIVLMKDLLKTFLKVEGKSLTLFRSKDYDSRHQQ